MHYLSFSPQLLESVGRYVFKEAFMLMNKYQLLSSISTMYKMTLPVMFAGVAPGNHSEAHAMSQLKLCRKRKSH